MPDGRVITRRADVDAAIRDILGVDRSQFCQIAMIAQGEFRKLLLADTKDRREIFRDIFKTNLYTRFQERVKADFLALNRERDEARKARDQYAALIRLPENAELPPEGELPRFLASLLDADRAQDAAWKKELRQIDFALEKLTAEEAKAGESEKNRKALKEAESSCAAVEETVKELRRALEKVSSTSVGVSGAANLERSMELSRPSPLGVPKSAKAMASKSVVFPAPVSPVLRYSPRSPSCRRLSSVLPAYAPKALSIR